MKKYKLKQWVKDLVATVMFCLIIVGCIKVLNTRFKYLNELEQIKTDCTSICNQ